MKPGVGIVGRGEPRSSTAAQPRGTPRRGWFRGEGAGEAHRGVATPRPVPAWLTTGPARSLRAGLVLGLTALLALGALADKVEGKAQNTLGGIKDTLRGQ